MPHFKAFGMRNLQYEIETCNRIHNKGTMSRRLIQVTIFLNSHFIKFLATILMTVEISYF
jgi:hypothetical protein